MNIQCICDRFRMINYQTVITRWDCAQNQINIFFATPHPSKVGVINPISNDDNIFNTHIGRQFISASIFGSDSA